MDQLTKKLPKQLVTLIFRYTHKMLFHHVVNQLNVIKTCYYFHNDYGDFGLRVLGTKHYINMIKTLCLYHKLPGFVNFVSIKSDILNEFPEPPDKQDKCTCDFN
jgi:hypothetical protein